MKTEKFNRNYMKLRAFLPRRLAYKIAVMML